MRIKAMAKSKKGAKLTDVCAALNRLAPLNLAQSWDNVGLLAGDPNAKVQRVMLCIDLTPPVAEEAIRGKVDLVMAYHPPLFKPISRLSAISRETDAILFRCIAAGIAIYSTHTALDAADGGTNDVLAELCNLVEPEPFEFVSDAAEFKLVTFAPPDVVDRVAEAMFHAGAGHIGDYSRCSYRLAGTGTFHGSIATNPAIGIAGAYETVQETRIETVVPKSALPAVVAALRESHPYEEPAFDVYSLHGAPRRGIGRWGDIATPLTLRALVRKLKRATGAVSCHTVGAGDTVVSRAAVCVGSAGSMPFTLPLKSGDCVITGEMRHHDALTILRRGWTAITLGHWSSERPALASFAERLKRDLPGIEVSISDTDCEPFQPV
jgi:dinuclear metal center YbgI/SA1388 family protein